jgi:uracil-DNA glycosylase family 4
MTKYYTKCLSCTDCYLHNNIKSRVLPRQLIGSVLSKKNGILFVGNFPSKEDDLQEHSFSSQVGKLLHSLLDQSAIDKEEVYLTNAVLCTPYASDELTQLFTPCKVITKTCSYNLKNLISVLEPRLIFALGVTASNSLKLLKVKYHQFPSLDEILFSGIKQELSSRRFILTLNKILEKSDAKKE